MGNLCDKIQGTENIEYVVVLLNFLDTKFSLTDSHLVVSYR